MKLAALVFLALIFLLCSLGMWFLGIHTLWIRIPFFALLGALFALVLTSKDKENAD